MPPNRVGRYEIIRELGRGGMASVFLAYDPHFKREVAVKVLPREFLHDPNFRARFEREAQTIASLEHPAIVPVHDFGEFKGQPFIVMRHMQGGSLADKLFIGPLPLGAAARILQRIAPAIDKAHRQGVIHRDLKPENILFDDEQLPYIADFGIAKLTEGSAAFTGSGILGTPAYMSPEQARGRETLDGRSDVYSLGVVLFEMLAGKLPFEADTPMGMAMAHVSEPAPDVRTLNRDLPPACSAVIERALAKERTARYATAQELAEALAAVEKEPAARAPAQPPVKLAPRPIPPTRTLHEPQAVLPPPAKPAPRRRWLPWAVAAGGLLILAFVLISSLPGLNPPIPTPSAPAQAAAPLTATPTRPPSDTPAPTATKTAIPTSTQTPAPTLTPTITPLPAFLVDASGAELALIPAGAFEMGSETGSSDESPAHTVFLDDFYIDLYEVTNAQFAACEADGACSRMTTDSSYIFGTEYGDPAYDNYPVIFVSWVDATAYCAWREARLPTEAEWEKAARGTNGLTYPWGNSFDGNLLNFCDADCYFTGENPNFIDGYGGTAPVGMYVGGVSPYGIFDLAGNVKEWVFDWYDDAYYASETIWNNPAGPADGESKVLRGSSLVDGNAMDIRSSNRDETCPECTGADIGFRCARSP